MKLRIMIDVFSGRPNPVIELEGAEAAEALERLRPARSLTKDERRLLPESTLGYRGLIIEQKEEPVGGLPTRFRVVNGDVIGPRLAHRPVDEEFEEFVCGSSGLIRRIHEKPDLSKYLLREIARYRDIREKFKDRPIVWPKKVKCACAPLYEPDWWNVPQRQPYNNCYNYATNYRSDTFAQPGLAAGAMYTSLTCTAVRPAAVKDDLIDQPKANNKCPGEGHLVALVIAPGLDFHWYRKGRNGHWSHKPGGTAVTNLDNSGNVIPDPRTADRGPYTDFCTFMVVMHGHIKIK